MIKRYFILLLLFCNCTTKTDSGIHDFTTQFEKSNGTETDTYSNVITFYQALANKYSQVHIQTIGTTDSGVPLHLVTYNPESLFDFRTLQEEKTIILINNGIHPGESDGIDATMMLIRDLAEGRIKSPENLVLTTIPIYNIGGALNRNTSTRTNQNGPKEYGFRGNARNYDLNRDFIKSDTKNALAFAEIFHLVHPDIFIDNHVSNGADYQYTLTHLFTQHNKLGGPLGSYLHNEFQPALEEKLAGKNWDITPYVNVFNNVPEKGFSQFFDSPRYSTGYTTLWNTLGMMVETHMLKPYKPRVEGTYELMKSMIVIADNDHSKIKSLRKNTFKYFYGATSYPVQWEIDTSKTSVLKFKGYEGSFEQSMVTGSDRLKYHRDKPFTKNVEYQNYFIPSKTVEIPEAYMIPKNWWRVIDLLKKNNIQITALKNDTVMNVQTYKIASYKTRNSAYEGHYLHYDTETYTSDEGVAFRKGDFLVKTNQPGIRYLLETLEPEATDSFFNWNFFDTILQQKEGFSPYVFEDVAAELLKNDPQLKLEFERKKQQDEKFASDWYDQLDWIHKRSDYYEKSHLRYPVYRLMR
ncbi:M14 family metallopeptidase [Zhouia spongiae]|uniref:M14 family metallopeptidase n=1 Tax=Zhouia spongiae TaxID=2202721 RepID=A0ABY3YMB7_9FLAO|nr:M14 family metallopeptidase [Zhouia spongiae]UNY98982.1 M14 family metallopeptidase [Zhouia spongiae]